MKLSNFFRPGKQRMRENSHLLTNPQGRTVLMECVHDCQPDIGGTFKSDHEGGADLGKGTATVWVPLQWETKVLAVDDSGALFADPFCPSCTRRGRRAWLTEHDGTGLTEAEILAIGQERIITLCFLLTQMMNPNDYRESAQMYPLLTVEFIAKHSCQRRIDVENHIGSLHATGWLEVGGAGKDGGSPQFKFAFGPKWEQFFQRVDAQREKQIDEAPKKVLAIDCGHESSYQVIGLLGLAFLDAELLAEFREQIANGTIELHRPLLCPECDAKEKARTASGSSFQ